MPHSILPRPAVPGPRPLDAPCTGRSTIPTPARPARPPSPAVWVLSNMMFLCWLVYCFGYDRVSSRLLAVCFRLLLRYIVVVCSAAASQSQPPSARPACPAASPEIYVVCVTLFLCWSWCCVGYNRVGLKKKVTADELYEKRLRRYRQRYEKTRTFSPHYIDLPTYNCDLRTTQKIVRPCYPPRKIRSEMILPEAVELPFLPAAKGELLQKMLFEMLFEMLGLPKL